MNYQDNMRQWTWQYCTEFAWFQSPNPTNPMRSDFLKVENWTPYCQSIFGTEIGEAKVDDTNNYYGGLNIDATQILFVNAIEDPWQYAGMRTLQSE